MPPRSTVPWVGLSPTTPQKAAGRMSDPAVWLPKAIGTIEEATAAADPLDEPPGVWPGLCGFLVLPGQNVANSVETVLPIGTAPARRIAATQAASRSGRWPPWDRRRAVLGRQVARVDHVLDPERHAVQPTLRRRGVGLPRSGDGVVGIEMGPGLDVRIAVGDPLQAGPHQRFRGDLAGGDPASRFRRRELPELAHSVSLPRDPLHPAGPLVPRVPAPARLSRARRGTPAAIGRALFRRPLLSPSWSGEVGTPIRVFGTPVGARGIPLSHKFRAPDFPYRVSRGNGPPPAVRQSPPGRAASRRAPARPRRARYPPSRGHWCCRG